VLAALWFNFAHYVLRPWPWIIVGLGSLVFFPPVAGEDPELGYPRMMAELLPVGLRGLMVASLLAAFMSTIDTQLNWGASYLVNDLYKRFIRREAPPRHYVNVSRVAMLLLIVLGALTAWNMDSIAGAWIYLMVLTAGAGFVGLLRWYWWRVNAWSEISALTSSLVIANANLVFIALHWLGLLSDRGLERVEWFYSSELYTVRLLMIIIVCTCVWVVVTYLTSPVPRDHLEGFYRRVRPAGWWKPIADACPDVPREHAAWGWAGWVSGVVCIYSGLFGIGYLCLARTLPGLLLLVVSIVTGWFMASRASAEPPQA
jgi:SSS family solute:Na+ symporter